MRIASLVARILLGALFTFAGVSAFFMGPPPPMPGLVGAVTHDFYVSHWNLAVAFAQLAAGILLLLNRYVTLALIIIGAFLYNSLAFHALLMPSTLPIPLIVTLIWVAACWPRRNTFARLFAA
ncbi:MAG TPA: hypothetical protein VFN49_03430 [Candidatus Aquilonibacter sp.]|nr:hypothetical protein [Candidatus Aquilonibacter sp.]